MGGNCCNVDELNEGCIDCNFRGLCEGCDSGHTLCGHYENNQGYGQCNVTIGSASDTVSFICGVGADGDKDGHPLSKSTDGYNYCGGGKCPCQRSQCYYQCNIEETCWVGSDADRYHSDWVPNFPGGLSPTGTPTMGTSTTGVPTALPTELPTPSPEQTPVTSPTSVPAPFHGCTYKGLRFATSTSKKFVINSLWCLLPMCR